MSFDKLSKPELVEAAEKFGVDPAGTKQTIIDSLEAEGVTWELYETITANAESVQTQTEAPSVETKVKKVSDSGDEVVLFFLGKGSYAGPDFVVSGNYPFFIIDAERGSKLVESRPEKFRLATAEEIQQYHA